MSKFKSEWFYDIINKDFYATKDVVFENLTIDITSLTLSEIIPDMHELD